MVLIDTWWNVNAPTTGTAKKTARVLIDTWWNVNFISSKCGSQCV